MSAGFVPALAQPVELDHVQTTPSERRHERGELLQRHPGVNDVENRTVPQVQPRMTRRRTDTLKGDPSSSWIDASPNDTEGSWGTLEGGDGRRNQRRWTSRAPT